MARPKGSKNKPKATKAVPKFVDNPPKITRTESLVKTMKQASQAEINKGGRPRKVLDYDTLDRLCAIQCTGEEIAAVLDMDYDTLNKALLREQGIGFSDYFQKKSGPGKASLRRRQFELAANGNTTMLVWLGKQYLGQTDKTDIAIDEDRVDKLDVLLSQFHDTNRKA
jgi:hypothetical protein